MTPKQKLSSFHMSIQKCFGHALWSWQPRIGEGPSCVERSQMWRFVYHRGVQAGGRHVGMVLGVNLWAEPLSVTNPVPIMYQEHMLWTCSFLRHTLCFKLKRPHGNSLQNCYCSRSAPWLVDQEDNFLDLGAIWNLKVLKRSILQ